MEFKGKENAVFVIGQIPSMCAHIKKVHAFIRHHLNLDYAIVRRVLLLFFAENNCLAIIVCFFIPRIKLDNTLFQIVLVIIPQRIISNTYWLQEIKGMKYHCKKGCENIMLIDTSVFRTKTLVYYNSKYHVRIILINNSSISIIR